MALSLPLGGCTAEVGDDADEGPTASVLLELSAAPVDAICHKAAFAGTTSFEKAFDVSAGASAPVALGNLPAGTFTLNVTAFGQTCATLPAGATPTWAGGPVSVKLEAGTITGASLFLRRPASTNVVLDYDTSTNIYTAPNSASIRGIAAQGNTLFVADTAQIVRLPEIGGGATTLATATGITAVGADANNLVWGAGTTMSRLPTMGFGVPRLLLSTGANMISVVNGMAITLDTNVVRAVPVNLANPSAPTAVFGTQMGTIATDNTNAYYADPVTIYKQALTSPGGNPGTSLASSISAVSLASDGTTLFFLTSDSLRKVPVAGGATSTMLSFFPTTIALVAVDTSNVYFLTTALSTMPAKCVGATLNRVAKNGTTATPVWSRPDVCPNRLAQTTTGLFLADTNAGWVLRVPK